MQNNVFMKKVFCYFYFGTGMVQPNNRVSKSTTPIKKPPRKTLPRPPQEMNYHPSPLAINSEKESKRRSTNGKS